MALFTVTDYDRQVWETELKDFLPDHLFDVHTHVYLKEFKRKAPPGGVKRTVSWPSLVAPRHACRHHCYTFYFQ